MGNEKEDGVLKHILASRPTSAFAKELKNTIKECLSYKEKTGTKIWKYQTTLDFLQWWFLQKRSKSTKYAAVNLSRKLRMVALAADELCYNIPDRERLLLKQTVASWENKLVSIQPTNLKRAPFLGIKQLRKLVKQLWHYDPSNRSKWLNKATAIAMLFCWRGGCRMIDTLRMRWEDMAFISNKSGDFIIYKVRCSKANMLGRRPERVSLLIIPDKYLDAYGLLKKWWIIKNRPLEGHVFQYREAKLPQTTAFVRAARKAAEFLKWPKPYWPGAHSGRNSVILLLLKLKVPMHQIKIFMRWSPNSNMPTYYQNIKLETTDEGVPFKLGEELKEGNLFKLGQDII